MSSTDRQERPRNRTHGSYRAMIARCFYKGSTTYRLYGAVGITVCDRWRESFKNFLDDMGERPLGKTLDRYPDRAGNYEPGNCRWATGCEQKRNRSGNLFITFNGETLCAVEWALRTRIARNTIASRVQKQGWSIRRALTESPAPIKGWDGTRLITFGGETLSVENWARRLGLKNSNTINSRLKRGWPIDRVLTTAKQAF